MKTFIKILILFLLLTTQNIFAKTQIDLSISKNKIDINEQIQLKVDIVIDPEDLETDLVINGLEDFDVLNQSRGQRMMIINGKQTGSLVYSFLLQAKRSGIYTIDINGNKETIEVTGEKVIVGSGDDLINFSKKDFEQQKQDKSGENLIVQEKNTKNNLTTQAKEEKIIGLDGKEMLDIYDIKDQSNLFPFNILYSLLYFILVFIGYVLYKKYMYYLENKSKEIVIEKPKEIDYKKLINSIEKEFLEKEKEVFYGNLGKFIRLYLDDKVKMGLSAKTLREIKGHIKKDIYELIEKIYFPEYDNKDDNIDRRKEILIEIKNKIIK